TNTKRQREKTNMPDITIEEVGAGFEALKAEVKSLKPDPEKLARINAVLDQYEEKNQALTIASQQALSHEATIAELKSTLEAKGVEAGKIRERVDVLETELARGNHSAEQKRNFRETDEYKAINDFCRFGDGARLKAEYKTLLRTDQDVAGGVLVPSELDSVITKKITEIDGLRAVSRVRSIGSKSLEVAVRATIPVASYEGETETGSDSTSTYSSETLTAFRQTFTSAATQDQLMDAAFDMESEIANDAGEAFAFGEGEGFVIGSGVKQPDGITVNAVLRAAARASATPATDALLPEDLIQLTGDLKVGYNPVYVLNRATLANVRLFRAGTAAVGDGGGAFLWSPGFNDSSVQGPVGSTLNGFPYIIANSMPNEGSDTYPLAFGDFRRGYTIVDRMGLSVIRDEFARKRDAIVEFTMNRWNTGRVTLPEAIKLFKTT
ncbi:MAG TPA: phage major capsid protein, partial [Planctomycetota bacterium]|nr:phage major capsid protein [Planctomycetota bacterium]